MQIVDMNRRRNIGEIIFKYLKKILYILINYSVLNFSQINTNNWYLTLHCHLDNLCYLRFGIVFKLKLSAESFASFGGEYYRQRLGYPHILRLNVSLPPILNSTCHVHNIRSVWSSSTQRSFVRSLPILK